MPTKSKSVDPSSSLPITVKEVPGDEMFPPATFIQMNRAAVTPGEVHVLQQRADAADPWLNAFELYEPITFSFHPGQLRTYGQPVAGLTWRTVKV